MRTRSLFALATPSPARPRASRRRAAYSVEFALCLTLGLVPVLFGIFDWSWYLFRAMSVQSMFHVAARVGGAVDMAAGICPGAQAETSLNDALTTAGLTGATITSTVDTYSFYVGGTTDIRQMTLSLALPFTPIVGLVPTPSTIGGTFTVPLEDQRDPADYGCS